MKFQGQGKKNEFKFKKIHKIKFKNLTKNFTKFKPKLRWLFIQDPELTTQIFFLKAKVYN